MIIDKAVENSGLLRLHTRIAGTSSGGRGKKAEMVQYPLYISEAHIERLRTLAHEYNWGIGHTLDAAIRLYFRGPEQMGLLSHPLGVFGEFHASNDEKFRRLSAIRDGATVFVDHGVIFHGITRKGVGNVQPLSSQCWELLGRCRRRAVDGLTSPSEIEALLELPDFRAELESRWRVWMDEKSGDGIRDTPESGPIEALLLELNLSLAHPAPEHATMAGAFPESIPLVKRIDVAAACKSPSSTLAVASVSSTYDAIHSDQIQVFKPNDLGPAA